MHSEESEQFLPDDTSAADTVGWRASRAVAERTSRRGFLAKAGKVAFVTLGVSVAQGVLPVHRAEAATLPCSDPALCGFCGNQCGCGNCSGDLHSCPGCACVGASWTACCCGGGRCIRWRYKDCFRGGCGPTKFNNCTSCRSCCGSEYPGDGPYRGNCDGQGAYMCTTVNGVDAC
jgi:hypothetical protein